MNWGFAGGAAIALIIAAVAGATFPGRAETSGLARVPGQEKCIDCHRFERVLMHPVDIAPSMAVPGSLPLTDGKLSCETCHVVPDNHRTGGKATIRTIEKGLCISCHSSGGTHTLDGMKAHLSADGASSPLGLDRESTSCLSCHDGAAATESDIRGGGGSSIDLNSSHPIGSDFQLRNRGFGGSRFVNSAQLDHRVRLFNQGVGCGSCHSVYSPEKNLLVMSNVKSQLCQSCHAE